MLRILFFSRSTLYTQPGGDTVQITETAKHLKQLGTEVDIKLSGDHVNPSDYDVVHFFNLSRPQDILKLLPGIKKLVVTSIYIDYRIPKSAHAGRTQKWLYRMFGGHGVEYVKIMARWLKGNETSPGRRYIWRGQKDSIQQVLRKADHIIVASGFERYKLMHDFGKLPVVHKINLGTEHLSKETSKHERKGVLCVARFEALKNQLGLIQAQKKSGFPLTFVGQSATNQSEYYKLCREMASTEVQFKSYTPQNELPGLYAGARVHALCSFYETTGLSTLEALKNGCQVVVSKNSAPEEIFAGHAHICDPADVDSITKAVQSALQCNEDHSKWVTENFSWEKAAHELLKIYAS